MNEAADFPETRWSLVLRAAQVGPQGQEALAELYRMYWYPLYAWTRGRGLSAHDAEDATQDFFIVLLARNAWAGADPLRGRLRTYMLTAFQRYLIDRHRMAGAGKRNAGVPPLSLDFTWAEDRYGAEPADHRTPEQDYDARWARLLFDEVLEHLGRLREDSGKGTEFAVLRQFLTPHLPKTESYQAAAARLGWTPERAAVEVSRLRARFRDLMRRRIADTLHPATEELIEQEWRALLEAMLRGI